MRNNFVALYHGAPGSSRPARYALSTSSSHLCASPLRERKTLVCVARSREQRDTRSSWLPSVGSTKSQKVAVIRFSYRISANHVRKLLIFPVLINESGQQPGAASAQEFASPLQRNICMLILYKLMPTDIYVVAIMYYACIPGIAKWRRRFLA